MKAQITLIELIIVTIALFIAFGVLFPGFTYRNKWREASPMLTSRDLILTIDRIGKIYNYSFDQFALRDFLDRMIYEKNLIPWSVVEGTFPNTIIVACNCTEEQISEMNFWFNPLMINNRTIRILFQRSSLENVPVETDIILIRGYKNLDGYLARFKDYLSRGIGILELMDFNEEGDVNNDNVQKNIFGLKCEGMRANSNYMIFSKPTSATNITYLAYKHFYHMPLPLNTSFNELLPECQYEGKFTLNRIDYKFWICDDYYIWFDTDADAIRDTIVILHETFNILGFNFLLNYIHGNDSIAVSFQPDYSFGGYLPPNKCKVLPYNNDEKRILVKGVGSEEYPAIILNSSKVAWMYDIGSNPSDDEKELLLSLLLWASKKKSMVLQSSIQRGFSTSYINVQNIDIFEVYKFDLGLSSPY